MIYSQACFGEIPARINTALKCSGLLRSLIALRAQLVLSEFSRHTEVRVLQVHLNHTNERQLVLY